MRRLALLLLGLAACRPAAPQGPSVVAVDGTKGRPPAVAAPPSCADESGDAATESDAFGRKVAAVCIEGASPGARIKLDGALGLKAGDVLTEASLARAVADAHKSGVADEIAAYGRKLGPGVVLVVRIRERPRVGKVTIEGAALANITVEQAPHATPLHPGEYYDPAYAHERAEALRAGYEEGGFADATVTPKTTPAGDGVVDVHMIVIEGPRLKIGKVSATGIARTAETEVLKASGLVRGEPLSSETEAAAVAKMEAHYHERGYINVKLTIERGAREPDASVPLAVTAVEGPQFRVGKIALSKSSLDAKTTRSILSRLKTQSGGVFRRSVVVADIAAVQQAFADGGRRVNVTPQTDVDMKKSTLDLNLEIEDLP